jgi:hypothetical protein
LSNVAPERGIETVRLVLVLGKKATDDDENEDDQSVKASPADSWRSEGDILPQAIRETRTKAGAHPSGVRPLTIEYKMYLVLKKLPESFDLSECACLFWRPIGVLRNARRYF